MENLGEVACRDECILSAANPGPRGLWFSPRTAVIASSLVTIRARVYPKAFTRRKKKKGAHVWAFELLTGAETSPLRCLTHLIRECRVLPCLKA